MCGSSYFVFVKSDDGDQPKETGSLPKPVCIASNKSHLFSHLHEHHTEVYSQLRAAMEKVKQSPTTQPKMDSLVKSNAYSRRSSKWKEMTDSMTYCIAQDMFQFE